MSRLNFEAASAPLPLVPTSFRNTSELLQEEKGLCALYPGEIMPRLKLYSKISSFLMLGITKIWVRTS